LLRIPVDEREPLAGALLQHGEDATDHNLPLMLWYGVEPIAAQDPSNAIHLAVDSRIPLVRQYIARRLGEEVAKDTNSMEQLFATVETLPEAAQLDILDGVAASLQGRHGLPRSIAWENWRNQLAASTNNEILRLAQTVGAVLGDSWAVNRLADTALNPAIAAEVRRDALNRLVDARPPDLTAILQKLLNDPVTVAPAAHALLLLNDPNAAAFALGQWQTMEAGDRTALVALMVSRPASASLLLDAVASHVIPRAALNAFHARQIRNFNDEALNTRLAQVWGEVHTSDADKMQLIARYRALLTPARLKQTDLSQGRATFSHTCAICHKLYGEGAAIGPDLTGSGRANLEYLLENIVDPSAIVPADYRVTNLELKDGRSLSALIVAQTDHSLTLQTPTEKFTIERSEITSQRQTKISLMPEGLLQGMKDDDICNLIAYLQASNQVPLPEAKR
jgi:putative heme-binding domain-containing protein